MKSLKYAVLRSVSARRRVAAVGFAAAALSAVGAGYWWSSTRSAPSREASHAASAAQPDSIGGLAEPLNRSRPAPAKGSFEEKLSKEFPGEWNVIRSKSGEVKSLLGAKIPRGVQDAKEALKVSRKIAALMGIDPTQVQEDPSKRLIASDAMVKYRLSQVVKGHSVYGAEIAVIGDRAERYAFAINSSLSRIGEFRGSPKLSAEQGRERAARSFGMERSRVKLVSQKPWLWASAGADELAWEYQVLSAGPKKNQYRVLVGANSGQVLVKQPLSIH